MISTWFGNLLEDLIPGLSIQFTIVLSYTIELLIACLIFGIRIPKRKGFFWILPTYIAGCFLLIFPISILRLYINSWNRFGTGIFHSTYGSLLILGYLFAAHKEKAYETMLDFVSINASTMLIGKFYSMLLNLAGKDTTQTMSFFQDSNDIRDWSIYWVVHIALYILFVFLFFNQRSQSLSHKAKRNTLILTIGSVLLMNIVFSISGPYENESLALVTVIKFLACLICLFILFIRAGLLNQSKKENEAELMHELFIQEKQQFDSCRASIDVINRKTHDLRHQLSSLQGKLSQEEIKELKDATRIYDSTIQTGNEVLDAIIYEKQLRFEKEGIHFTCMLDGKAVSFIKQEHLYSLMNNLLGNAIEATSKLKEGKIIDLTIKKKMGFIIIEELNTFDGQISFDEKNRPVSEKKDGHNHGFGTKNISYIVKEYHGEIKYQIQGNTFRVLIYFPENQ